MKKIGIKLLLIVSMLFLGIDKHPIYKTLAASANPFGSLTEVVIGLVEDGVVKPLGNQVVSKDAILNLKITYVLDGNYEGDASTQYTFSLPDIFNAPATSFKVKDGNKEVATVTVGMDGQAVIVFASSLDSGYLIENATGEIQMNLEVDGTKIKNGENTFNITYGGSNTTELEINFKVDQLQASLQMQKSVEIDVTNSRLKWTVELTPDFKNLTGTDTDETKLSNLTFTNKIDPKLTLDDDRSYVLSVSYSSGTSYTVTIQEGGAWKVEDIVIDPNDLSKKIVLTYYTTYDLGAFETTNDAKFQNSTKASFQYAQYDLDDTSSGIKLSDTLKNASALGDTIEDDVKDYAKMEAEIESVILGKESAYAVSGNTQKITWTVTYNAGNISFTDATGLKNEVVLKDTVPKHLNLVSVTYNDTVHTTNLETIYARSDADNNYSGGELELTLTNAHASQTITYVTEIDPTIWMTEPAHTFINNVRFEGYNNGKKYTFTRVKKAEINFGGTSGGLIGGSGVYDTSDHTIAWTINLNTVGATFTGGKVTLSIPNSSVVEHDFDGAISSTVSSSIDQNTKTITIPNNGTGVITFKTQLSNPKDWATNTDGNLAADVVAHFTTNDGINIKGTPTLKPTSKVIAKDAVNSYNFQDHTLEWKITLNQNKMDMNEIVLQDVLPAGLTYHYATDLSDGLTLTNATLKAANGVTYNTETNTLVIKLNKLDKDGTPPTIIYKTKVDPSYLNQETTFKNNVQLTISEFSGKTNVSAEKKAGTQMLKKTGISNNASVDWSIFINSNEQTMNGPELIDTIPQNLIVDIDSIQLYNATIDANGVIAKGNVVQANSGVYTYVYDFAQTLKVKFAKPINTPYILEYTTDNTVIGRNSYSNKVEFSNSVIPACTSEPVETLILDASGFTNVNRAKISIQARDKDGNPINRARIKYTLRGKKGYTYTAMSDGSGKVIIGNIKFDTYELQLDPDTIPSGVVLTSTHSAIELTSHDLVSVNTVFAGSMLVTYHANDTTNSTKGISYAKNTQITLESGTLFTYHGFVMTGWNTAADGNGTSYALKELISSEEANFDLYAQWKVVPENPQRPSYPEPPNQNPQINVDANGNLQERIDTSKITNYDELPSASIKDGFVFVGYYYKKNGVEIKLDPSTKITSDMEIYLRYDKQTTPIPNPGIIEDAKGNIFVQIDTSQVDRLDKLPKAPVKDGYIFEGYFYLQDGVEVKITDSFILTPETKVYFKYKKDASHTINPGDAPLTNDDSSYLLYLVFVVIGLIGLVLTRKKKHAS